MLTGIQSTPATTSIAPARLASRRSAPSSSRSGPGSSEFPRVRPAATATCAAISAPPTTRSRSSGCVREATYSGVGSISSGQDRRCETACRTTEAWIPPASSPSFPRVRAPRRPAAAPRGPHRPRRRPARVSGPSDAPDPSSGSPPPRRPARPGSASAPRGRSRYQYGLSPGRGASPAQLAQRGQVLMHQGFIPVSARLACERSAGPFSAVEAKHVVGVRDSNTRWTARGPGRIESRWPLSRARPCAPSRVCKPQQSMNPVHRRRSPAKAGKPTPRARARARAHAPTPGPARRTATTPEPRLRGSG